MQRTIKLKLNTSSEHVQVLRVTLEEFTRAFNYVCEWGWQNTEKNGVKLHHATYYNLKNLCKNLVSDLIVQARMKATEALKSVFTHLKAFPKKLKKYQKAKAVAEKKGKPFKRREPQPPRCPHSRLCPARYNLHTYKLDWAKQTVKLSTGPGNRLEIGFTIPPYAVKYTGYPVDSADLIYRKGKFWLHVVVTVPEPEISTPGNSDSNENEVIGVDLGLNHPAVSSNRLFLGQRRWKALDRRYFRLKRALQSKGTKSARKHLRKLSGRLLRFRRDCDHVLSKHIVQSAAPGATIVLENLTEIRETTQQKGRESRRRFHSWTFAQLRGFIGYKAEEAGVQVVAIDPRHTSQTCSRCGHQSRSNRRTQALFLCQRCKYSLNADLNAAYNIRDKHLTSLGTSLAGGLPVNQPIVSGVNLGTSRPALAGGC